jgi:hypothetical protein
MADPLFWPKVLVPSSEDWSLRGGTRSGGQTFQGNEQIVASPSARWKATLSIPCMRRDAVLAMRQVIALGRSQQWYVGPLETTRAPWNIDFLGGKITYGRGEKDAALDPAYQAGQDTSSNLDFRLSGAAGISTTSIVIQRNKGGVLEPGMTFSLGARLYTIVALPNGELAAAGQQGPAGVIAATIRPLLRAPYPDGTVIEFGAPIGIMRLASDDTGAMELQLSRYGTVTVELVEAF